MSMILLIIPPAMIAGYLLHLLNKQKSILASLQTEHESVSLEASKARIPFIPMDRWHAERDKIKVDYKNLQRSYRSRLTQLKNSEEKLYQYDLGVGTMDSAAYLIDYDIKDFDSKEKELDDTKALIKKLVKDKQACSHKNGNDIVVNGKKSEAKKLFNREIRLRLRCFDNEVKAAISIASWHNINRLVERLKDSFKSINERGKIVKTFLSDEYLAANVKLLKLTYEVKQIKTDIKEQDREEKALLRGAEREEKKIKAAAKKAEELRQRMETLVAQEMAKFDGANQEQKDLLALHQEELEILKRREIRAVSMAQLTRSGYVYVISNKASFGDDVTKIGMTRRVNPFDRIKELGDASVPELFEVHAFYFSDDAPEMEKRLHNEFAQDRVNLVNRRKEFFFVAPFCVMEKIRKMEFSTPWELVDHKNLEN
jgi:hypothetical protein